MLIHTCQTHGIIAILFLEVSGRKIKLVITQEHKGIIERLVTSNKRFAGNEDLFEDFCAEALEKSLFLLNKTTEIDKVASYLNRIVSNAMINVLKTSGRVARSAAGYKNISQYSVPLENPLDNGFLDIKDPAISFVEKITEDETLGEIYECILRLDRKEPEQKFGLIFYMKYVENKKQREIASALNISQGEVSKRLLDLMQKISKELD